MNNHLLDAPSDCACDVCQTARDKVYGVTISELRQLHRVAKRLYSENRMDGDQMRDAGHTITAVIDLARKMELS